MLVHSCTIELQTHYWLKQAARKNGRRDIFQSLFSMEGCTIQMTWKSARIVESLRCSPYLSPYFAD